MNNWDWAQLYREHGSRVRRSLHKKLRRAGASGPVALRETRAAVSAQDVDDITQEVFVRALASGASSALGRDPVPYLLTIARNRLIDWLRRQKTQTGSLVLSELSAGMAQALPSSDGLAPEDYVDRQRSVAIVERRVARLSGELLAVYEARFVNDLSQRDAAVMLGLTRRRVRTLEQRLVELVASEL